MKNMAAAPTYFPVILSIVEKLPALYPSSSEHITLADTKPPQTTILHVHRIEKNTYHWWSNSQKLPRPPLECGRY
jgi:hypothetical protein